jgi:hypothetical protein
MGRCPLELAQGPSRVALAWHQSWGLHTLRGNDLFSDNSTDLSLARLLNGNTAADVQEAPTQISLNVPSSLHQPKTATIAYIAIAPKMTRATTGLLICPES